MLKFRNSCIFLRKAPPWNNYKLQKVFCCLWHFSKFSFSSHLKSESGNKIFILIQIPTCILTPYGKHDWIRRRQRHNLVNCYMFDPYLKVKHHSTSITHLSVKNFWHLVILIKHCQRHNGPEGWVQFSKVQTNSNTNLYQISSRPSINCKISTKHQHLD